MMSRAKAALARAGTTAIAILVLASAGGLLIAATEPSIVAWVEVEDETCEVVNDTSPAEDRCSLSGFERHGGAFLLLGALAIALGAAASLGGGRAASGGVLAIGVLVLAMALLGDLPETGQTGATGPDFETAAARAGSGFYMELAGGALCLVAGALGLAVGRGARKAPPRRTAQQTR
jgi:hypothetical protein